MSRLLLTLTGLPPKPQWQAGEPNNGECESGTRRGKAAQIPRLLARSIDLRADYAGNGERSDSSRTTNSLLSGTVQRR